MARTKGMLNLSGNLEVNAQAPLDARTIVPTEADLTVASNFPYPYVGLEVYVTGTGKKFRLTNLDTTQSSSWHEIGEGGGSGGGGHTIQDDGVDMTARDNLNFVGFNVTDDSTNNRTTVTFPNIDLSVLSNEAFIFSETEKVVGQAPNGKLLYQKSINYGTLPNSATKNVAHGISNLECAYECFGTFFETNNKPVGFPLPYITPTGAVAAVKIGYDATNVYLTDAANYTDYSAYITIRYTKTTDSPLASDVKFAGVTGWGEVKYSKTFTGSFAISPSEFITYNDIVVSNAKHLLNVELVQDDGQLGDYYITTVKGAGFTADRKLRMQGNVGLTAKYVTVTYTTTS